MSEHIRRRPDTTGLRSPIGVEDQGAQQLIAELQARLNEALQRIAALERRTTPNVEPEETVIRRRQDQAKATIGMAIQSLGPKNTPGGMPQAASVGHRHCCVSQVADGLGDLEPLQDPKLPGTGFVRAIQDVVRWAQGKWVPFIARDRKPKPIAATAAAGESLEAAPWDHVHDVDSSLFDYCRVYARDGKGYVVLEDSLDIARSMAQNRYGGQLFTHWR